MTNIVLYMRRFSAFKNKYVFLLAFFFFSSLLDAQENIRVYKSEFRTSQSEGFKQAWRNIRKGNRYYKRGKGYYKLALEYYTNASSYNDTNPELNYKTGVCHLYSDDRHQAISYLRYAFDSDSLITDDIHYMLGRGYHLNMQFDRAIKEYTRYLASLRPKKRKKIEAKIQKFIEECHSGIDLATKPNRVVISNLGIAVNSTYDDYNPVVSRNDSVMYFTTRRPKSKRDRRSPIDFKFFEEIYMSVKDGDSWGEAKPMGKKLNTGQNDAAVALSPDNGLLFICRGAEGNGDIKYCKLKENGEWSKPGSLPRVLRDRRNRESAMCVSSDGRTIYFISQGRKDSYGGKDIYVSHKNSKGKWQKPVNIGSTINTQYNETGVFVSANDSVLYFSSKGHNTIGGYDIFRSKLLPGGGWSSPENLGIPLNTPGDDVFLVLINNRQGYYSANREGGFGGTDLFKFTFIGEEKEMRFSSEDNLIANAISPIDPIFRILPGKLTIDTLYYMYGLVADSKDQKGVMAKIDLIDIENSQVIATGISDSTGSYKLRIPKKKNYGVNIVSKDYMLYIDVVNIPANTPEELIQRNFSLSKIDIGSKVVLKNIFFDLGKAKLRTESYTELSNVLQLMRENPTLRIEVSGHTDNTGTKKENKQLSAARAKAVATYLTDNGVDASRIESVGYGSDQPVVSNKTKAGRQQNRRVEFKIIGK